MDKKIGYKKQGKANRAKGARFELKVKRHLAEEGWIVMRNQNQIDLDKSCFVPSKAKFLYGRPVGLGSGFPDFICWRHVKNALYEFIFVECKYSKYLKPLERDKMKWLEMEGHKSFVAYNENNEVKFERTFMEHYKPHRISSYSYRG